MGGGEDATPAHTLPFTVHSRRFLRSWAAAKIRFDPQLPRTQDPGPTSIRKCSYDSARPGGQYHEGIPEGSRPSPRPY